MNPRFAIVNTTDAPIRSNVAEWVEPIGYCYMARSERPDLKAYDGMRPKRPTNVEDFGFQVEVLNDKVLFHRVSDSVATYEDGVNRKWQDTVNSAQFSLHLVVGVRQKGKAISRRP